MPVRGQRLRTDYPPKFGAIHGSVVNAQNQQLNGLTPAIGASHQTSSPFGALPVGTPPVIFGIARIIAADNTCPTDIFQGGFDAPCAREFKYEAVFRYWDQQGKVWASVETHIRIDSGIYHNGTVGTGSIPTYAVGDIVPAYYDPKTSWCWPIHPPPELLGMVSAGGNQPVIVPQSFGSDDGTDDEPAVIAACLKMEFGNNDIPDFITGGKAPVLIIEPFQIGVPITSELTFMAAVKDRATINLKCACDRRSRRTVRINQYGFTIRFLARFQTGGFEAGGERVAHYGFSTGERIPNQLGASAATLQFGQMSANSPGSGSFVVGRYFDTPILFNYLNGTFEFRMDGDPFAIWLIEVTINATAEQLDLYGFLKVANESGQTTQEIGKPIKPNADGYFDAVVVRNHMGEQRLDRQNRAWLAFADNWGSGFTQGVRGKVIAETGRVYGPCDYVGIKNGKPLFVTTLPVEEYFGKYDGNKEKGEEAELELWYKPEGGAWSPSGIRQAATFDFNKYRKNKFAVIKRAPGGGTSYTANQIECSGADNQQQ